MTTNGRPMDNQRTTNGPHRIGKDRLGKDRLGEEREDITPLVAAPPSRHKYGEYKNVLLLEFV